jgi:hypothetical protein
LKGGKLTDMKAKSGLERLRADYQAAGPGRDEFGFIDIGINPNVRLAPGSKMVAYMPAGTVTLGVGHNLWAGGENSIGILVQGFLDRATVKVDGRVLVENGILRP